MRTISTNIGENIKILREEQNVSRKVLAEMAGISMSHLEKVECGARKPSMDTYQRILDALQTDVVMFNEMKTVQEECVVKAQKILMECSERQALYLVKVLEFSAKNIDDMEL